VIPDLEAIVVGAVDLGESDRIVRLLSAEEGRGSVVARGARSSRRRFAGATELGTRVRVGRNRTTGLPAATALERLDGPNRARSEIERIALLAYGAELCAALAPEGLAAVKLYRLLVRWLEVLEADPRPDDASRVALETKALTFAGLAPALVVCSACRERLTDPAVFDAESGGGLHARCGGGRSVAVASLWVAEALRRTPLADAPGVPVPDDLRWLLSDFAQHQLGRPLHSRALLATL
jgi:DNA repair protein RecO (recombination protein O)